VISQDNIVIDWTTEFQSHRSVTSVLSLTGTMVSYLGALRGKLTASQKTRLKFTMIWSGYFWKNNYFYTSLIIVFITHTCIIIYFSKTAKLYKTTLTAKRQQKGEKMHLQPPSTKKENN